MSNKGFPLLLLALLVVLAGAGAVAVRCSKGRDVVRVVETVADVRAVHAEVFVGDREIRGEERLSDGDRIRTGDHGRARVRIDDGSIVAVGEKTSFSLAGKRLTLERGRLFVSGSASARTEVALGDALIAVAASSVSFERVGGEDRVYCAEGELVLTLREKQSRVASGETATIGPRGVTVAPEAAFDDWTFGLAVPWAPPGAEKSAIPDVRARSGADDPGSSLVVRSQDVDVTLDGEVAVTRARTTLFNGGSNAEHAGVRLWLPEGALLKRVTRRSGAKQPEQAATLVISGGTDAPPPHSVIGLEWAGGGFLRGDLGGVAAGETLELELEYNEWLDFEHGRAAYRFPMAGSGSAELVSELDARVDFTAARTRFVSVTQGATVKDGFVHLRKTDFRPVADLVVEVEPALLASSADRAGRSAAARAYVSPVAGEDPYVLVRTEVPRRSERGVTLVLVVDTSMSVGASALETERAVVDAILEGLGPRDSVAVLLADQNVSALGPARPAPVDARLRSDLRRALAEVRPGGASNLGLALQRAADLLDQKSRGDEAGSGMVLYLGDGRPTVGESSAESLRRRLGRRTGGMPRLGAVAIGAGADRFLLSSLVEGTGSVYEVEDRSDAARAGAVLLADALLPTLRDVEIDLGPNVDRVYPRSSRAVLSGSTVSVVGRLRGKLPSQVAFRFRDGARLVEETRPLQSVPLPRGADLAQRWAAARLSDMAARDDGVEPAIALAASAGIVTPWTSFTFGGGRGSNPTRRVLELSPARDTAFAWRLSEPFHGGSTLLEPPATFGGGVSLVEAAEAAIRRVLGRASNAVRACRDARANVRPDVGRSFRIDVSVDARGVATSVRVTDVQGRAADAVLERCIAGVVESLPYFAAGLPITMSHTLTVPEGRASRRTKCSGASKVALPLRKGIWSARGNFTASGFVLAAQSCELPKWEDRRAFLLLALEAISDGSMRLALASELEAEGESDAANYVRRETLRRVTSFEELSRLRDILMAGEPAVDAELDKAYAKATTDAQRLEVVLKFRELAPHNGLVRRRLFSLLEVLGKREALVSEIAKVRAEPFADAGVLSLGASALRRVGLEAEGRRAFGELIERAPNDPWTLAYVGDRLRAEGMFDEAHAAYESLWRVLPGDASVSLRMALAHAGAGRLDAALRLLDRVTQTGGRGDDGRLGELAAITKAALLAGADPRDNQEARAELGRRLLETPLPDVLGLVLVQSAPSDDPVEVRVQRERGEGELQSADLDARTLGLSAVRIERGDGKAKLNLIRKRDLGPSRPARAVVLALSLDRERGLPKLERREVDVPANGEPIELALEGGRFL
jgi:tetratricopeptide (TPR) repeat protein